MLALTEELSTLNEKIADLEQQDATKEEKLKEANLEIQDLTESYE